MSDVDSVDEAPPLPDKTSGDHGDNGPSYAVPIRNTSAPDLSHSEKRKSKVGSRGGLFKLFHRASITHLESLEKD